MFVINLTGKPKLDTNIKYKTVQKVKSGSTLTLEAEVSGVPTPDVTWLFNDSPVFESAVVSYTSGQCSLRVSQCTADMTGKYTVKAENSVGSATLDFTVQVKGQYFNVQVKGQLY